MNTAVDSYVLKDQLVQNEAIRRQFELIKRKIESHVAQMLPDIVQDCFSKNMFDIYEIKRKSTTVIGQRLGPYLIHGHQQTPQHAAYLAKMVRGVLNFRCF